MAYTMIAERDGHKVRKQRESALIVLANARVMESEGWQVVITNNDGQDLGLAEFEAGLAKTFSSWFHAAPQQTAPATPVATAAPVAAAAETLDAAPDDAEALVAAELAAEAIEADAHELQEVHESEFEDVDAEEPEFQDADLEKAVLDEIALEIATTH